MLRAQSAYKFTRDLSRCRASLFRVNLFECCALLVYRIQNGEIPEFYYLIIWFSFSFFKFVEVPFFVLHPGMIFIMKTFRAAVSAIKNTTKKKFALQSVKREAAPQKPRSVAFDTVLLVHCCCFAIIMMKSRFLFKWQVTRYISQELRL